MGYSCTKDAADTLAVINKWFRKETEHVLVFRGQEYFFERGREQDDGSITGKLMRMLPNDYCEPAGTVKINADGSIARFPFIDAVSKIEIVNEMRDLSARNPQLLRQWSMGNI